MASGGDINVRLGVEGAGKVQRELKKTGDAASAMGKGAKAGAAGAAAMGGALGTASLGAAAVTGAFGKMKSAVMSPAGMAAVGGVGVLAVSAVGIWATVKAVEGLAKAYRGVLREAVKLSEELDTVGKKARSIGADPEQFQTLIGAMQLSGIESDKAMKALQKLNQGMGEAMKGTKSYTDAFDALNLSAADLARIPLTERMLLISDGMDNLATNAERAQVAALLLGRTGKDMLVTFEGGRAGLQAAIEDIARFGVASNEAVTASEDLQDSILRARKAFLGLRIKALAPLLPTLTGIADGLAEMIAEFDPQTVKEFSDGLAEFTASGAEWLIGLGMAAERAALSLEHSFLFSLAAVKLASGNLAGALETFQRGLVAQQQAVERMAKSDERWLKRAATAANAYAEAMKKASTSAYDKSLEDLLAWGSADAGAPTGGRGAPGKGGNGRAGASPPAAEPDLWALFYDPMRERLDAELEANRQQQRAITAITANGIEDRSELQRQAASRDAQSWQDAFGAIASMVEQLSALMITVMGEENEEAKKAAKVMFGISQSMHIARATVAMFDAIAQANALGYPQSVPAMIVAGATGAANIAAIVATTIQGVADAGLPPGALRAAGLNNHTMLAIRNDEMVLDPVGTRAISEMLTQRSGGQPTVVNTVLEIDGHVLGQTVDTHLIRSQERGLPYGERARYGSA